MHGRGLRLSTVHVIGLGLHLTASAIMLAVAGCSTAPIADFLDLCYPSRFPGKAKDPHGGVCIPQGGPAGGVLGGPPPGAVVVPPGGPVGPGPGGPTDLPPPLPPPGAVPLPKG
jgi:hypothetical protein